MTHGRLNNHLLANTDQGTCRVVLADNDTVADDTRGENYHLLADTDQGTCSVVLDDNNGIGDDTRGVKLPFVGQQGSTDMFSSLG